MTRKKKDSWDKCTFGKQKYYDELNEYQTITRIPYTQCDLDMEGLECPYTARHCSFKAEQEEADMLIAASQGIISTEQED